MATPLRKSEAISCGHQLIRLQDCKSNPAAGWAGFRSPATSQSSTDARASLSGMLLAG
jgi:hypothetical protein